MQAYDFEYDGFVLSNYGYMICDFKASSNTFQTISNGAEITFNTVPFRYGEINKITGHKYDQCLTTTFHICKIPCTDNSLQDISNEEIREISRWLNRENYHPLRMLCGDFQNMNFNATMKVSRVKMGTTTIGFELVVITDSSFAYGEEYVKTFQSNEYNWRQKVVNYSDSEGYIYPEFKIKILNGGLFQMINENENRVTVIKNCVEGEEILLDNPIITTSEENHKIQDDFNWNFPRMSNSNYMKADNVYVMSLPSIVTMKYKPFIKLGF